MIIKEWAIGIGITVLLPLMVYYGARTFGNPPDFDDYRVENYTARFETADPEEKLALGEEQEERREAWREHLRTFNRLYFYTALPAGLAVILIGTFLSFRPVASGLMFGGIITLVNGYMVYWGELPDWMRFGSICVAFAVLVTVGIRMAGGTSSKNTRIAGTTT